MENVSIVISLVVYTFLFLLGALITAGLIVFFGSIYERYKNKRNYGLHRVYNLRPIVCGLRDRTNIGG